LQSKINRLTFNQQRLLDQGIERYVRAIQHLADRAKDAADMNTASSKLSTNLDFKKAAIVIGENFVRYCEKHSIMDESVLWTLKEMEEVHYQCIKVGQPRSWVRMILLSAAENFTYWIYECARAGYLREP
jgi:hypothetical protein